MVTCLYNVQLDPSPSAPRLSAEWTHKEVSSYQYLRKENFAARQWERFRFQRYLPFPQSILVSYRLFIVHVALSCGKEIILVSFIASRGSSIERGKALPPLPKATAISKWEWWLTSKRYLFLFLQLRGCAPITGNTAVTSRLIESASVRSKTHERIMWNESAQIFCFHWRFSRPQRFVTSKNTL
jgi:hypothetical protein